MRRYSIIKSALLLLILYIDCCATQARMTKITTESKRSKVFKISGGSRGPQLLVPPLGPLFFHFHAVFVKNYAKNTLAPTLVGAPPPPPPPHPRKSWIRH